MDISELKAKIYFYLREQLYNSMLVVCNDGLKKFVGEATLNFYHAIALNLNNRMTECIRELEVLKNENDIRLASTLGLIYAYRKSVNDTEKETFAELEVKLREYRKSATITDFCNSAFLLFCLGKYEKALDYVEKSLKLDQGFTEALALKGWVLLKLNYNNPETAIKIFETCTADSKRNLDASLGTIIAYLHCKANEEALTCANKCIVRFSSTNIPLVYKLKVAFAMQDYDLANEVLNRILSTDDKNYVALRINILMLLCRKADYKRAANEIGHFVEILEILEPKNGDILAENGRLFSRLCARNSLVLNETHKMLEKCVYFESTNVDYLIEFGFQCLLQGRTKEAMKYFKSASKCDNTSFNALLGMTLCELTENGKSDQIKQQIFFLLELQDGSPNPMLTFMRAKLSDNVESSLQFLEEACNEQLKPLSSMPYTENYLLLLNPDFLLDVIKTYLEYKAPSATVIDALSVLTKVCPGFEDAQFLLARVQYMKGDYLSAMRTLNYFVNELETASSDAHLLMAQIHLNNGAHDRALQSLEVGLSHNFKVRENPLYHLILGLVEKNRNNLDEAIKSFTTALSLIDIKPKETSYKKRANEHQLEVTLTDKATIYIELIESHRQANQIHEATKLMEDATEEFQNTPEESRIMILGAEYAANTNNVQRAIDILSRVKPNESYYLKAKTKLAEIFLVHRQDKKAFMNCYNEMVQFNPGSDSFLLLGDAYMKILEPDKALEAYNNALQTNPTDPSLTSKMGKALIDTHYYKKAVLFYTETIALTDNSDLKLQLAELYMELQQYDKAEMLLTSEIEAEKNRNCEDLISLQYATKLFVALADVCERAGNMKNATEVLKSARDNQNRVRKILMVEQTATPEEEINILVQINKKLAEIAVHTRENERAINHYKDALSISPENTKILAALAKLYMQMHYLELCQQTCTTLLKYDSDNEIASVLMADIAFRKVDFDMSVFHFTQLVNKQPTNWNALVRLVEVMKRTGNLEDIPEYLQQAEQHCERTKEPGLFYCTALYQWYTGNLNGALRNFNSARQDPEWGQEAIYNMIEICLNPEDEILGDQFIDIDDVEYRDSRTMALSTAQRLLREVKQKMNGLGEDSLKCRMLGNFLLIASKEKHNIEQALEDFINLASSEAFKDHVGPILGMATAYTMLKQAQRAKTQLKRVVKYVWTFEDAEYLERCWLLLADYYIQSNKNDLASDLLRKVLQHNKACYKAYEYAGFVLEKEQKYKEAAQNYELAWKYNGKSNSNIGYKLAYNLMKCKRYAEAIDIGQQVLKTHPDHVRIKKDILDKSINNLRT